MQNEITLFLIQLIIFGCLNNIGNVKAMIGSNINQASSGQSSPVVCFLKNFPPTYKLEENVWCAGTLITLIHVLTSEHCVTDVDIHGFHVAIGAVHLSDSRKYYPLWWWTFENWAHSNGVPIQFNINDIAMLKLIRPIDTTNCFVHLPILTTKPTAYFYGRDVVTFGWGLNNAGVNTAYMQTANLKTIAHEQCVEKISYLQNKRPNIPTTVICSFIEPYILLETGDSGAPLFYENELIAVNNGNTPKINSRFNCEKVNIHTGIEYYLPFINFALNL